MAGTAGEFQNKRVLEPRADVLASHLAALLPPQARVLDVGCGDATIDRLISQQLPEVSIEGIDAHVRPDAHIPVRPFDGINIPYPDNSFDVVMFVDVLHHTDDPLLSLQEARRAGKIILIKDRIRQGFMAGPTLRIMDLIGNTNHGVVLPCNYWSKTQWDAAFDAVGLEQLEMKTLTGLYPAPASWIFERSLHFISRLEAEKITSP